MRILCKYIGHCTQGLLQHTSNLPEDLNCSVRQIREEDMLRNGFKDGI